MGKYLYQSHLGGLYTSDFPIAWDSLYCETCGDSDWEMGFAENREEAEQMIEDRDLYEDKYIKRFLDDNFPEDGDTDG